MAGIFRQMIFRYDIAKRSPLCYDEEDNVPAIELELRFFLGRRLRPCEGTGGIGCKSLRVGHCEALPAASPTGRISQIHRAVRCGTCLHRDCLHKENALLCVRAAEPAARTLLLCAISKSRPGPKGTVRQTRKTHRRGGEGCGLHAGPPIPTDTTTYLRKGETKCRQRARRTERSSLR